MAPLPQSAGPTLLRRPATEAAGTIDWSKFLKRSLFSSNCFDCNKMIADKTVLITGAGGSIGSALACYLMGSFAKTLVLLDHSRQHLGRLYREYAERNITLPQVKFFHADLAREKELENIFSHYRPQIVFHLAAMKRLPELEHTPFLALENNLLGTLRLLLALDGSDVEQFIHVSTDKAVNPTSILGVSKRITEVVLLAMDRTEPAVASIRLGNVLGSSGSVVPRFMRCLQSCRPLMIRDMHASRYFITLEEAAAFLMSALEVPGNSLLVPDMGVPRRIEELVDFLLYESRSNIDKKSFRHCGLRDGEKRDEQLTYDHEYLAGTPSPYLFKICSRRVPDWEDCIDHVSHLLELVVERQKNGLLETLAAIVPEFTPSQTLLSYLQ